MPWGQGAKWESRNQDKQSKEWCNSKWEVVPDSTGGRGVVVVWVGV